jgi:DNA-directed RNA polymerase subunit omega
MNMPQRFPVDGGGQAGKLTLDAPPAGPPSNRFTAAKRPAMRDDYIKEALKVIPDPNMLINVVSRRVKQLRRGNRPLVESLEKLSAEDTALREISEGKISYEISAA